MIFIQRLRVSLFFLSACLAVGCSPASFFGSDKDSNLKKISNSDHKPSRCAGLDLSGTEVTAPVFRKIVDCLNDNDSIDAFQRLVAQLKDDELVPLLSLMNKGLLAKPENIRLLNETFEELDRIGAHEPVLRGLGKLLENEDFWIHLLAVMGQMGESASWPPFIEETLSRVNEGAYVFGLEQSVTLLGSRASASIQATAVNSGTFRVSSEELDVLAKSLVQSSALISDQLAPGGLWEKFIKLVSTGDFFRFLDQVLGADQSRLSRTVPPGSALLGFFAEDPARGAELALLFSALDRPIPCLRGAQVIPNGVDAVLKELAMGIPPEKAHDVFSREYPLFLAQTNGICEFPPELFQGFPLVYSMADAGVAPATVFLSRGLFASPSLAEIRPFFLGLIRSLADEQSQKILKSLQPVMSLLNRSGVLQDLLLMVSSLRPEDRDRLTVALDPVPAVHFLKSLSHVDPIHLSRLFESTRPWIESKDSVWLPFLMGMRDALLSSEKHPLLDIFQVFIHDQVRGPENYRSMSRIAQMPEMRSSIRLMSKIAKDGTLKEVMRSLFVLFKRMSEQAPSVGGIGPRAVPAFIPLRRHDLSRVDLLAEALPQPIPPTTSNLRCRDLSFSLHWSDYQNPRFSAELKKMQECEQAGVASSGVLGLLTSWNHLKVTQEQTLLQFEMERFFRFTSSLSVDRLKEIVSDWKKDFDSGGFDRWMGVFAKAGRPSEGKSLFEAIADLARPLLSQRDALDKVQKAAGTVLTSDEFPSALSVARNILGKPEVPSRRMTVEPPLKISKSEKARWIRWVHNFESERLGFSDSSGNQILINRLDEIVADYRDGITNWDLQDGHARRSWSTQEFMQYAKPVLDKLSDPDQSAYHKSIIHGLRNVLRYFTLQEGEAPRRGRHYHESDLVRWFQERSQDIQPIAFYYPDETAPRVRLVNSLDRLEIILTSADLTYGVPLNLGLYFLGMIAEAWGDEPRELWPLEIRMKYPSWIPGRKPRTLAQVYQEMLDAEENLELTVGYPDLPKTKQWVDASNPLDGLVPEHSMFKVTWPVPLRVKASVFNIRQVLSVMKDNLPGSGHRHAGGMRVLRDLFWELHSSTPWIRKNSLSGDHNNLSTLIQLVRLGIARQAGRGIREYSPDDRSLQDISAGLIRMADQAETEAALESMVRMDPDQKALLSLVDGVRSILNSEQAPEFKQTGFYLLAQMGQWISQPQESEWTVLIPKLATRVIHDHHEFFATQPEVLSRVLGSKKLSQVMRALYEHPAESEKLHLSAWLRQPLQDGTLASDLLTLVRAFESSEMGRRAGEDFLRLWNIWASSPELKDGSSSFLAFFDQPFGIELRRYLASRCAAADWTPLLETLAWNPKRFGQELEAFAAGVQDGRLKEFLSRVRRNLPENSP